jgi:hypothetical protein
MGITVREILVRYLRENSYDGLYSCWGECACKVDDLEPCGDIHLDCTAGYIVPCNCSEGCDFHIGEKE